MKINYMAAPGIRNLMRKRSNAKDTIVSYIEHATGVKIDNPTRMREVVQARQLAMYVMRQNTYLTTEEIGKRCGGKDHATVIHACNVIENALKYDRGFRYRYERILKHFDLM